jgi:hypothetical protein
MPYFLKDNYYVDIDEQNQLRITGPGNHLLLGLTFPAKNRPVVERVREVKGDLSLTLAFATNSLSFVPPVVTDIRTIRNYTESVRPKPSYKDLARQGISEILPGVVEYYDTDKNHILLYENIYNDEEGEEKYYGAKIIIPLSFSVKKRNGMIVIEGKDQIRFRIKTQTNISIAEKIETPIFAISHVVTKDHLNPFLRQLYRDSKKNIEFLIRTKKTSSFEYGTIFPRDWIESADLGINDLTIETVDYMYSQSMRKISQKGEAWHEDVIGHFKQKIGGSESIHIDRKMIDIEPRYIMGVPHLSNQFLLNDENHKKLLLVSRYILENAKRKELISFKMQPGKGTGYYVVGNWRDSGGAFPSQKPPLSPYDVNCVFYPTALRVICDFSDYFQIKKKDQIEKLVEKWDHNKEIFRLFHPKGVLGYALALSGKKSRPLPIAHLDESYDLFYGKPSMQEIVSFAKKLIDPKFFYTPVGPILVAADEDEFTTSMYHGKVIWPKQAAYAVAGLGRQYRYGKSQEWPGPILHQIKESLIKTCEACFRGWGDLGFVPELYYYDKKKKKARLYVDQKKYEGQMSNIQLWSSVGARRIIREYLNLQ